MRQIVKVSSHQGTDSGRDPGQSKNRSDHRGRFASPKVVPHDRWENRGHPPVRQAKNAGKKNDHPTAAGPEDPEPRERL